MNHSELAAKFVADISKSYNHRGLFDGLPSLAFQRQLRMDIVAMLEFYDKTTAPKPAPRKTKAKAKT